MTQGTETDVELLRKALVGKRVVSARLYDDGQDHASVDKYDSVSAEGELILDDGTQVLLAGHIGGCSCSAGDYDLASVTVPSVNSIMDVQVQRVRPDGYNPTYGDYDGEGEYVYRIFVLAFDTAHEVASFEGTDGSGYYGTGFYFRVLPPGTRA